MMEREHFETGTGMVLFVNVTGKQVKVSLRVIMLHDMKTRGGLEV
jgi:hypothetical protein